MSKKINDDSKILSVRVPAEMRTKIKATAALIGLTPSVYVRQMLFERFPTTVE